MSELNPVVLIAVMSAVLLLGIAAVGLFPLLATRRWTRHRAETVGKWEAEGVTFRRGPAGGQFGGLESMGVSRIVRGIGFVALTDRDVRVTRATPSAEWHVTLKQIKGVTIQPTFMGNRGQKTPFIVIRFVKDAQKDKLAFQVNDYEAWAAAIAKAAKVSVKRQGQEESDSS